MREVETESDYRNERKESSSSHSSHILAGAGSETKIVRKKRVKKETWTTQQQNHFALMGVVWIWDFTHEVATITVDKSALCDVTKGPFWLHTPKPGVWSGSPFSALIYSLLYDENTLWPHCHWNCAIHPELLMVTDDCSSAASFTADRLSISLLCLDVSRVTLTVAGQYYSFPECLIYTASQEDNMEIFQSRSHCHQMQGFPWNILGFPIVFNNLWFVWIRWILIGQVGL